MTIPVTKAEALSLEYNLRQVIIFGWDGKQTHVTTYGKSVQDCDDAARGANEIKKKWGWPASKLESPPRVKKLEDRIVELELEVLGLTAELNAAREVGEGV